MSRPTLYTQELSDQLCALVKGGLPLNKAAEHEGITYETMRAWGKKNTEFSVALKKARAEAQAQSIAVIRSGAQGWQGEAWYLERSDPKNWGRRFETKQEVTTNVSDARKKLAAMTPQERIALFEQKAAEERQKLQETH